MLVLILGRNIVQFKFVSSEYLTAQNIANECTHLLELKMNKIYHWNGHVQHCCTLDTSSWDLMSVKGMRDS